MKKISKQKKGFTLIELLAVMAMIGILAAVVLVASDYFIKRSRVAQVTSEISRYIPDMIKCHGNGDVVKRPPGNKSDDYAKICEDASGTEINSWFWPHPDGGKQTVERADLPSGYTYLKTGQITCSGCDVATCNRSEFCSPCCWNITICSSDDEVMIECSSETNDCRENSDDYAATCP